MLDHRGEYPENWREIAERIKREADYRCVRCGHWYTPGANPRTCGDTCQHPRDGKARVLTVHHMDGDKANCRWWNLLPLCQVCHLQIQAKLVPESPYLFEHKPWFRVYAAGFYAWYYAAMDITREEADRDTERYILMGQPWLKDGAA